MFNLDIKMIIIILVALILLNYFFTYSFEGFTLTQSSSEAIQNLSSIINTQNLKVNTIESTDLKTTNVNATNVNVNENVQAKNITASGESRAAKFIGNLFGDLSGTNANATNIIANDLIRTHRALAIHSPDNNFGYEFRTGTDNEYVNKDDIGLGIWNKASKWWVSHPRPTLTITKEGRLAGKIFDGGINHGGMGKFDGTANFKDCRSKCDERFGGRLSGISRHKQNGECWCHDLGANGTRDDNNWEAQYIS